MAGPMGRPPDLTALACRHLHQSVALKFGAFSQGLTAEKQRAMVAFLEQAVYLASTAGSPDSGTASVGESATLRPSREPGRRESAQGSATLSYDGPAGVARSQLVEGVLPSLLRQVDPTAEIVELTLDPDGLSYTVQLRTQGETSKPRSLSVGLLALARNGHPVAIRAVRTLLTTILLEIRSRQTPDSTGLARV